MNPEEIKTQIIEQIKNSKIENKDQAIMQVKAMTKEQLEAFVKQQSSQDQCIFCSIIKGEIPSTKIDENEGAIAILELNPISKAHTLIIPKIHIESADKIPPTATNLAKKITDLIKEKFKPKDILMDINQVLGHIAINIIPVYNDENLETKRTKQTPEQLEQTKQELLKIEKIEIKEEPKKQEPKEIIKIKPRIP